MKKILILFLVLVALLFAFVGCSKDNDDEATTESTTDIWGDDSWWQNEPSSDAFNEESQSNQDIQNTNPVADNNNNNNNYNNDNYFNNQQTTPVVPDNGNNNQNNNNNNNNNQNNSNSGNSIPSNPLISDEDLSKLEQSEAEVYFSDNPNNKYIVRVVNKYGVDASNLVALIKVNATFPSAMVLEFSGKRDANGELVMTYSELKYVYNIDESNNKLVRAGKNGIGNDGVSIIESTVTFALMEEYFCPELPNLKANKRYD